MQMSKIYLDADVEERAKRRFLENQEKGIVATYEETLEDIKKEIIMICINQ